MIDEYVQVMGEAYDYEYIPKVNEFHPDGVAIFYRKDTFTRVSCFKSRICKGVGESDIKPEGRVFMTCLLQHKKSK